MKNTVTDVKNTKKNSNNKYIIPLVIIIFIFVVINVFIWRAAFLLDNDTILSISNSTQQGLINNDEYTIIDISDISIGNADRYKYKVLVNIEATPEQLNNIIKKVTEDAKVETPFNALCILLYDYKDMIYWSNSNPSLGTADFAPYGDWSRASEVATGKYDNMSYKLNILDKDWDERPNQYEIDVYSAWDMCRDEYRNKTLGLAEYTEDTYIEFLADALGLTYNETYCAYWKVNSWQYSYKSPEKGVSLNDFLLNTFGMTVLKREPDLKTVENSYKINVADSSKESTYSNNTQDVTSSLNSEYSFKNSCNHYDYDSIARNPQNYIGMPIVLCGQVIQVIEDNAYVQLRVNITKGEYDLWENTIFVDYMRKSSSESRILEDDIITIWGICCDTITYESILGSKITLPYVQASYIEQGENIINSYLLPDSDVYYLTDEDLNGLSPYELLLARNEIYARHGRMFISDELQEYFNSKSWYSPTIPPDLFDESILSEVEIYNVHLIQSYEDKLNDR